MKKVFSFLAVLALVSMVSSVVWAENFTGPDKKTALAEIKSGVAEFSVELYEWENTYSAATSTGTIHWDNLGDLTLFTGVDEFRCANAYALIKSTMTKANSVIYVFQDNANNTGGYAATAPWNDGTGNRYDGLVEKSGTKYAKLSYLCVTKSSATTNIKTLPTAWPSWEPHDGIRVFNNPGNHDWASKKTSDSCKIAGFVDTDHYGTLISFGTGEYGYWTKYIHDDDVVMLFGAQFSYVQDGESYGTNTITFQNTVE